MKEQPEVELAECYSAVTGLQGYGCFIVNRSGRSIERVRFMAGNYYYGGRDPVEVSAVPPHSCVPVVQVSFVEVGPEISQLVELVWADGAVERDAPLPRRHYDIDSRSDGIACLLGRVVELPSRRYDHATGQS